MRGPGGAGRNGLVLGPGRKSQDGAGAIEGDVVEVNVFIGMWSVGAELEAEDIEATGFGLASFDGAVFDQHIADDGGFAAAGDDAAAHVEFAVFDVDMFDRGTVFVGESVDALAALEGDAVVVVANESVVDVDIAGGIDIDAVGGGGTDDGSADVEAVDFDVVAVVDVEVPEAGVEQVDAGDAAVIGFLEEQPRRGRGVPKLVPRAARKASL